MNLRIREQTRRLFHDPREAGRTVCGGSNVFFRGELGHGGLWNQDPGAPGDQCLLCTPGASGGETAPPQPLTWSSTNFSTSLSVTSGLPAPGAETPSTDPSTSRPQVTMSLCLQGTWNPPLSPATLVPTLSSLLGRPTDARHPRNPNRHRSGFPHCPSPLWQGHPMT